MEQLVPRPVFRQGPSLAAGGRKDVFPAELLQPQALILMKKCVSCCYFSCHISSLKPDPLPFPGRRKGPALYLSTN